MKKVQVGNIYKIDTQKVFALMQLVKMPEDIQNDIELVKIGYHLFDSLPEMNDTIFRDGYFFVQFPVKVALRRKLELPLVTFSRYAQQHFLVDHWITSYVSDQISIFQLTATPLISLIIVRF